MSTPIDSLLKDVQWVAEAAPESNPDDLPYVTHYGVLKIGDAELRVARLSSGQSIIVQEDFERFFGVMSGAE